MGLMDGKVAIVTGAGRGLGRAEALLLAEQGAAVVVNELDADAGQSVVDEIRGSGGTAALHGEDCSTMAGAESLVRLAVDELGGLDALVNNAGIVRDRTLVKMTEDEWDAVIQVHLKGHFAPTHFACQWWKDNGRPGRVVCTSSTSGLLGNFGQTNYGAAKAGIAAFANIVSMEMARYGVTCNAVAPAARTRMTEGAYGDAIRDAADPDAFDFWAPENVAPMVVYLCSDASAGISGKTFGVQGNVVELYQPWTSFSEIVNEGGRWDPEALAARVDELFEGFPLPREASNGMARLRYSMTERA
jgi:NAD(P)-dependent dehydrogenase (short-subunit alcohol dehydrogenase family)